MTTGEKWIVLASHVAAMAPGSNMEAYALPSPWTSPEVWQSMQPIPESLWTSLSSSFPISTAWRLWQPRQVASVTSPDAPWQSPQFGPG